MSQPPVLWLSGSSTPTGESGISIGETIRKPYILAHPGSEALSIPLKDACDFRISPLNLITKMLR